MDKEQTSTGTLRFSIGSIPVAITPSFWIITVILASSRARGGDLWPLAEWVFVVLASVLVHELGHALAAQEYGRSVRIELHALGGTTLHQGAELRPWGSSLISLAGPLAGIAFGALIYFSNRLWPPAQPLLTQAVRDALWVNWGYGLLNLLPVLPLDGGNIMQQIVNAISRRKNESAATIVSLVVAVGLFALAMVWQVRALLFLLGWIAIMQVGRAFALYNEWRDRQLEADVLRIDSVLPTGNGPALQKLAEHLLDHARSTRLKARAINALTWSYIYQYDLTNALNALNAMPSDYKKAADVVEWIKAHAGTPDADVQTSIMLVALFLRAKRLDEALKLVQSKPPAVLTRGILHEVSQALFMAGRYRDSLAVSEELARTWKSPRGAYNAACALVRLGQMDEAEASLAHAVELGEFDFEQVLADEDLAPLRALPRFPVLLEQIKANAARRAATAN